MFGGLFKHNLDSAGRFVMPYEIRLELGPGNVYITKGVGCLCVFTEEYAKTVETEFNSLAGPLAKLLNPDVARLHRHFFSGMVKTSIDKQNRTPLTPEHRRYAGITEEIVVCGCGSYVELWSPTALDDYMKANENTENLIASGEQLLGLISKASGDADAGISQASPA